MKKLLPLLAIALAPVLAVATSPAPLQSWPPPTSGIFDWLSEVIEEPYNFEHRSSVFQLGIGFRSNVQMAERASELNQLDVEGIIPALSLTFEKNIGHNIGVGLILGTRIWRVPVFHYQYRYYVGGLRATYHFNVLEKLDPYIGGAVSYRRISLTNQQEKSTHNSKVSPSLIIGARYYLTEHIGGFFEIGNDAMSWFKAGVCFYFSKKES